MPIYEYHCNACGVRYEKIVFSTSASAPPCPSCGSSQVEKLISVPGGMSGGSTSGPSCGASSSGSCGSGFS